MEHLASIGLVVEQLLDITEEVHSGIFCKHLGNGRDVFTCKCPGCQTLHGGYRTFQQAYINRKCVSCNRKEVEKTKKEVAKVDEPKRQKNIFQNRLNKPVMIEAADPVSVKEIGTPLSDAVEYEIFDGREWFPVTREGMIGRESWDIQRMSGSWVMVGMTFHHWSNRPTPWRLMKRRMNAGESLNGYIWDKDHNSIRRWGRRAKVYKMPVVESSGDMSLKDLMGGNPTGTPPGAVTKEVCMAAHYRQEFYHRKKKDSRGSPLRIRVNGKCKTWATRPDEFSLPVKFGLYQTFYLTDRNAEDWTTICPRE